VRRNRGERFLFLCVLRVSAVNQAEALPMESSAALGAPGAVGARLRATAALLRSRRSPASGLLPPGLSARA
jgi:hypothetical protein